MSKKDKIVVVFSTHLSKEENDRFKDHIKDTVGVKHSIIEYENPNKYSLSELYNRAFTIPHENSIYVFLHNDIVIKTKDWGKILLSKFNNTDYGIIGVAGTTFIPESGCWWDDRSKMYGIVEHTNGIQEWISEFSNPIKGVRDVVHIDGVFMSVDPDRIKKKFNTDYGKFHFYDLTFCVDNYLEDVNIGVITDIRLLHKSVGQTDQNWEDNRIKFSNEYKDNLPLRFVPEKLRILICCQFFKNYTGSEVSNYELSRELVKMGHDVTLISGNVGNPIYLKAKNNGVKVYQIANAPNFRLTPEGQLTFIKNECEFDIIHINHKPIGENILKMYPNTPAVMHVRSEVIPIFEEPIINPIIKKYISIRDSITDYIKTFGIDEKNIVNIDNPFDYRRFNTDYKKQENDKKIVLFVGTLDHLRKNILFDIKKYTRENNQLLWIIGDDSNGYVNDLLDSHVKYFNVVSNVEDYIKKVDYTAGIFKGRTTIEGFLCGKPGWVYEVDKNGKILNKVFIEVPDDIEKYRSDFSAKKIYELYESVIEETWID